MRFWTILFLIITGPSGIAHEGHQAYYRLHDENGTLMLVAKLESPDVKKCLEIEGICGADQDPNLCAGNWLMDGLSVSLDGKTYSLKLESTISEDGHLLLNYSLGNTPSEIVTVAVHNSAFLNAFGDYDNTFQLNLLDRQQGYRMSANRTDITIDLREKR